MQNLKKNLLLAAMAALCLAGRTHAAPVVVDAVNPDALPTNVWQASNVGWLYTPAFSYTLTGVGTKFGAVVFGATSRTVTAQVFSGKPGEFFSRTPSTLSLLASGTLTPIADQFSDAVLSTAVALTAGTTYFIGFSNVLGLGANFTDDPAADTLGDALHSDSNSGPPANATFDRTGISNAITSRPIIEFLGIRGNAVPEPAGGALTMAGLVLLGFAVQRRRRQLSTTAALA